MLATLQGTFPSRSWCCPLDVGCFPRMTPTPWLAPGAVHAMGCICSNKTNQQTSVSEPDEWTGVPKPHYLKEDNTLNTMGNFQSVTPDPRLPFSKNEIFKLLRSWRAISREMSFTGMDMFLRIFRQDAELMNLFSRFKEFKSVDDLKSSQALEYHASRVMSTLDDAIVHIDNYDYVYALLNKTGAYHTKFPGFKPEYFKRVKEPFMEAVNVTLGDRYSDTLQDIYLTTISFIIQMLMDGIMSKTRQMRPKPPSAWSSKDF